ncbi:DUF4158 domain-containing protein [Streptomyces sp. NPDC059866]|uniref:DUF4158 domain-containing protein n=1 Tax=Streptomyces sp. NPDC059866 TaxID=3346978 RepID=UPI00365D200F
MVGYDSSLPGWGSFREWRSRSASCGTSARSWGAIRRRCRGEVVGYLAGSSGSRISRAEECAERRMTPYNHAQEIRERFGYRDCGDRKWSRGLRIFLHGRAWTHVEGPTAR